MPTSLHPKPPSLSKTFGQESRGLSPQEVRQGRLDLACDMLRLLLADAAPLAPATRRTLRRLYKDVLALRGELRARPGGA
jgi:hypothetical protein